MSETRLSSPAHKLLGVVAVLLDVDLGAVSLRTAVSEAAHFTKVILPFARLQRPQQ